MIFATSPSVVEEQWPVYKRYNKMIEEYNDAAVSIVKSHGGDINDLYKITLLFSVIHLLKHFYK